MHMLRARNSFCPVFPWLTDSWELFTSGGSCRGIPTRNGNYWKLPNGCCTELHTLESRQHPEYIPCNMHMVVLCFTLLWFSRGIHVIYSTIFFRVTSLALGHGCPSASEVTLKDIDRIKHYFINHNICIVVGMMMTAMTSISNYIE